MECGFTALVGSLQPPRGNQIRHQARKSRRARRNQAQAVADLSHDLRSWLQADGDQCSRITCAEGSFLNDDNECEKRRGKKPVAKRNTDERPSRADRSARERPAPAAEVPRRQATARPAAAVARSYCDQSLCRQVSSGCHLEYRGGGGPGGNVGNVEVLQLATRKAATASWKARRPRGSWCREGVTGGRA